VELDLTQIDESMILYYALLGIDRMFNTCPQDFVQKLTQLMLGN